MKNKAYEIHEEDLKKTTFNKIKIGEIFAFNGCWTILMKVSDKTVMFIDSDNDWGITKNRNNNRGGIYPYRKEGGFKKIDNLEFDEPYGLHTIDVNDDTDDYVYRLPKKIQKLWGEQ